MQRVERPTISAAPANLQSGDAATVAEPAIGLRGFHAVMRMAERLQVVRCERRTAARTRLAMIDMRSERRASDHAANRVRLEVQRASLAPLGRPIKRIARHEPSLPLVLLPNEIHEPSGRVPLRFALR